MPKVDVYSNHHQVNRYPCGLDVTPGLNEGVELALVQAAIHETDGMPNGVRSYIESGVYEVRKPQISVKRRGS